MRQHEPVPYEAFISRVIRDDVHKQYSEATFQDIEFDYTAVHVPSVWFRAFFFFLNAYMHHRFYHAHMFYTYSFI